MQAQLVEWGYTPGEARELAGRVVRSAERAVE
jgi:hypothetical protein